MNLNGSILNSVFASLWVVVMGVGVMVLGLGSVVIKAYLTENFLNRHPEVFCYLVDEHSLVFRH